MKVICIPSQVRRFVFVFGNFSFVIRECQLENSCWFPLQVGKLHGMAGIRLEAKLLSKNSQITLPQTKQGVGHASPSADWALAEATICTHKSDLWRPLGGFWWAGLSAMVLVYYRYRVWAGHNSVCFACWWCATHLSLSLSLSPAISLSFCLYLYCQLCFEMKNADNCNKSHTHTWRGEATCRAQHKLKNANSFIKIIYDPTDNKKTGHITLRRPQWWVQLPQFIWIPRTKCVYVYVCVYWL